MNEVQTTNIVNALKIASSTVCCVFIRVQAHRRLDDDDTDYGDDDDNDDGDDVSMVSV